MFLGGRGPGPRSPGGRHTTRLVVVGTFGFVGIWVRSCGGGGGHWCGGEMEGAGGLCNEGGLVGVGLQRS